MPAVRSPAVECDGLVVDYGDIRAVDSLSFHVDAGEVYGLLGPNGAGKTSVIRALTTIVAPTAGRASVAGASLDRPTEVRRNIGVLPESNGYPNSSSALGYLTFYGRLFGINKAEAVARANDLLAQVGLAGHRGQRIGTFSRGMRQRLGIARAMVNRPRVLFLDEPTLGLDPAGKEEVMAELGVVAADTGASVVLCSHLLDEVERICDRVGIMHKGRLAGAGTVTEVAISAGVAASAFVTVSPQAKDEAQCALEQSSVDCRVHVVANRRGEFRVDLADPAASANEIAGVLVDAKVPILSIEMRGAQLSDAFFALTGASALEDAA